MRPTACERYEEVCLIDSLRAHRYKVQYTKDGPFWALADGNTFLQPWQNLHLCFDRKFFHLKGHVAPDEMDLGARDIEGLIAEGKVMRTLNGINLTLP